MPSTKRRTQELKKNLEEDAKRCKSVATFFSKKTSTNDGQTTSSKTPDDENTQQPLPNDISLESTDSTLDHLESSSDSSDDETCDNNYWKTPVNRPESSDSDDGEYFQRQEQNLKEDKRYYGSTKYESDHSWLYFSQVHRGWMCKICEKYPYSSGRTGGAFSMKPCMNSKHPAHAFRQHASSTRHQRLEKKINDACTESVLDKMILGAEKRTLAKIHTNNLYLRKCIHTLFFMIKKHIALTDNYGDMIRFIADKLEEAITLQYLQTCPKNATYISNTTAESLLDAINVYFETKQLEDIKKAPFLALYADEAENSSHKECFSMFVTYFSFDENKVQTAFLGIVNLKSKTSAQIMDVIKLFFTAKGLDISKVLFSVLDGTNSMSGKHKGLQRRIRNYSPYNIYINCRNHRLALCLPHLMKNSVFAELLLDYDALLLGIWKMFHYSPKRGSVLESIQQI